MKAWISLASAIPARTEKPMGHGTPKEQPPATTSII